MKSKAAIVVVQNGFVYVGNCAIADGWITVNNAFNIRAWGTTEGLGQLVMGPLHGTQLDKVGTVRIPMPALISLIDVNDSKWSKKLGEAK